MTNNTQFLEYVLMCQKATEIQKLWNPVVGDKFVHKDALSAGIPRVYTVINIAISGKDHLVWLPYQEELQNFLTPDIFPATNLMLESFIDFIYSGEGDLNLNMTLNQLYLAFAMLNREKKMWKNKEWQPITDTSDI